MSPVLDDGSGTPVHVGGRSRPFETRESHPHCFRAMAAYINAPLLPIVPVSFDWSQLAREALADILGNDVLGDCLAAGALHLLEAICSCAGSAVSFTRDQAVRFYSLLSGYDPTKPETDHGGDEITALTTWRDQGLDGSGTHRISGWISVEANHEQLKLAAYLFGGLYCAAELPDPYLDNPVDGFVWDVVGPCNPNNGHCFVILGATERGFVVDSWGRIGLLTYAAAEQILSPENGGGAFAVLTPDIINAASLKSPAGLDWSALLADSTTLGLGGPNV